VTQAVRSWNRNATKAKLELCIRRDPRTGNQVKGRIDPELKRQAEAVLEEIGLKPRAALELFYKQIIKRRAIPFPVLADSPEDEVLSTAARRTKLADEF
jgi:addiction module RelB/DinJ family antitoxin